MTTVVGAAAGVMLNAVLHLASVPNQREEFEGPELSSHCRFMHGTVCTDCLQQALYE